MEIKNHMYVDIHQASILEGFCRIYPVDCGRGEVLFDRESKFLNGNRMAIQVIAPEEKKETAWTQGVLFDEKGNELGHTEVGEDFLGEYIVPFDGHIYIVEVLIG